MQKGDYELAHNIALICNSMSLLITKVVIVVDGFSQFHSYKCAIINCKY
mgnify:CR=1 FL=1